MRGMVDKQQQHLETRKQELTAWDDYTYDLKLINAMDTPVNSKLFQAIDPVGVASAWMVVRNANPHTSAISQKE